jgi:membrane protease subunit (stomatin/prohibitin family)
MPLLRRVAGVAAVGAIAGGTAGAVQHRQQGRWARKEEEQMAAQQQQQQMAAAPPPPEENSMEKLKELGQLHESGVLTDDEFAAAKAKILSA